MKKINTLLFILLSIQTFYAQRHEVGVILGGSNAIADIGNEKFINPNRPAVQLFYKRNINERYAVRLNLGTTTLKMDDADASATARKERNFSVESTIYDASANFEINFFDFNKARKFAHTPYMYAGIGATSYRNPRIESTVTDNGSGGFNSESTLFLKRKIATNIPFGVGYKFKVRHNWVLGAEVGARYTFTDNIDKSNPEISIVSSNLTTAGTEQAQKILKNNFTVGNENSNDWYVFTGLSIAYTFGRPPCDCRD